MINRFIDSKKLTAILALILMVTMVFCTAGCASKNDSGEPADDAIDYSHAENWVYFSDGALKDVDLFFVGPTVDLGTAGNYNMGMDDQLTRQYLLGALNMEKGIFKDTCRIYSPYYRQITMTAYDLGDEERHQYLDIAYADVRDAFMYYMEHENNGRPFMLAGFSQGGELVIELMKEFLGDGSYDDQFVCAYAMGWRLTEEEVAEYPQLVPASGADDLGVAILFDCEAEGTEETLIVPKGVKTYSINPLNWKTDSTVATRAENIGACFTDYDGHEDEYPALCGAYINEERGTVIVTDVTPEDYPEGLASLGKGSYHIYDYQFFYRNLQANVALRAERWIEEYGKAAA